MSSFISGTTPNFPVCTADKKVVNPAINATKNRLHISDDYDYDSVVNTIEDPDGKTFVYDGENKQVSVSDGRNESGVGSAKLRYSEAAFERPSSIMDN